MLTGRLLLGFGWSLRILEAPSEKECLWQLWQPVPKPTLVGGFHPFEKYARQNGNLPQV